METPVWCWPVVAAGIFAVACSLPLLRSYFGRTVFLSYRRSDGAKVTSDLAASLRRRFGRGRVFHDAQSIKGGANFRRVINDRLRKTDAVVVVIGPDWANCRSTSGSLRLHEPDDLVRAEVAAALSSGALVIPLLICGAVLPRNEDLPPNLAGLLDLNAMELRDGAPAAPLIAAIVASPVRRTPALLLAAHVTVLVLLAVFRWAGGLVPEEFIACAGIVTPLLAATAAVTLVGFWLPQDSARMQQVDTRTILVPYLFVAMIALLVVLKSMNIGTMSSPTGFEFGLAVVEAAFGAYTGVALSQLLQNRREP